MSAILKRIALYLALLVVIPFVLLEGAFRLLPVSYPPYILPVSAHSPVARFQPNVEYAYSSGWDFSIRATKRSNNFGFQHASDYRAEERTPLLMVIGDSFVEAPQVGAGKTAPELLHAALRGTGRVYSIGVSGAPLSQYLVFAEYARTTFRPQAMAFFIIGNDFDESLLKYKSDPRFHYFEESAHGLGLRRVDYEISTAKKILRKSAFMRYVMLNVAAGQRLEALAVRSADPAEGSPEMEQRIVDAQRAVEHFLDLLPAKSGLGTDSIVFVLDAVRPAIYSADALRRAEAGYHARMRRYFERVASARGYQVIDLQPVFIRKYQAEKIRFDFPTDSHWNELGHRVVADELRSSPVFQRTFKFLAVQPAP